MSWLNSLFSGGSKPAPGAREFPFMAEVGELRVHVHRHELKTRAGELGCWTFVTDGLERKGHREAVLTLTRLPEEEPSRFPEDLLAFFGSMYELAGRGQVADVGSFTDFGPAGFGGRADLGSIAWLPLQPLEGVKLPARGMTALLLTRDERALAKRGGMQRVVSRLGMAGRHFPFPPWNDRKRETVVKGDDVEQSLLTKIPVCGGPGMSAWTDGKTITLSLTTAAFSFLKAQLEQLPPNAGFALITEPSPEVRAQFVWQPGQTEATAIQAEGRTDPRICGNFLALLPGQADTGGKLLEDGFAIVMKDAAWAELRAALIAGKAFTLTPSVAAFPLEVRPAGGPAAAPGAPAANTRIMLAKLALKSPPEAELPARLEPNVFMEFVNALGGSVAQAAVSQLQPGVAAEVVAKVTIAPPRELDVLVVPGALGASFDLRAEAERRIRALQAPEVKGPVAFDMEISWPLKLPPGFKLPGA